MATVQPLIPYYYNPAQDPDRMPEFAPDRLGRIRGGLGQAAFDGALRGVGAAGDSVGDVGLSIVGAFTGEVPTIPTYATELTPVAMSAVPETTPLPVVDAQQIQALMARQMPPSPQAAWLN